MSNKKFKPTFLNLHSLKEFDNVCDETKKRFSSLRNVLSTKPTAFFVSGKGDIMSKILREYDFDVQLLKKSEFGWVEKQCQQLNIKGCRMLCLMEKQPI